MRPCTFMLCLFLMSSLNAQPITIGGGGDFPTLEAAESSLSSGDTAVILDGVYSDGAQFLTLNGTLLAPVVIMADNLHQAIFRGGTEAIHLTNCSFIELHGLVIEQQTGNGINIDDGGNYDTPTHHITIQNCIFRDMVAGGNNDLLKLSGLDSFIVKGNQFLNGGAGGSGVDMVGCHWGTIEDNVFDDSGVTGIQAKGGTQFIRIQRNVFRDMSQRAINLGGSTGLQFFRPPLPDPIVEAFEAADLEVFSNIFIRSWAPIAYVGCVRVKVYNNTFLRPENWVIRILQETTEPGFLTCANNEFKNNIVYQSSDLTEVNIGPNTDASSFLFSNNLWYNESSNSWTPLLPVPDFNQIIADPLFESVAQEDVKLTSNSPAIENGASLMFPETDFNQNFFFDPRSIGAYEGHSTTTSVPYQVLEDCIIMGPNPSASKVTIDGDFSNANIFVLNASGEVVEDLSNAMAPVVIELDQWPNGIYFIRIVDQTNLSLSIQRLLKVN